MIYRFWFCQIFDAPPPSSKVFKLKLVLLDLGCLYMYRGLSKKEMGSDTSVWSCLVQDIFYVQCICVCMPLKMLYWYYKCKFKFQIVIVVDAEDMYKTNPQIAFYNILMFFTNLGIHQLCHNERIHFIKTATKTCNQDSCKHLLKKY